MLERIFSELGPWNWMVLGLVLLGLEIVLPGVFLLWIGVAALIVGAVSLALWHASFWVWQVQTLVFLVLAVLAALAGKKILGGNGEQSDQPLLNRRSEQLIGRTALLTEPIREGHGRIQLGDTLWRVAGPDLPPGARVRVIAASGEGELVVEAL